MWFVLGLDLCSFVYAACGALVQEVTEVGTAVMPVSLVMVAGYLLSLFVVLEDAASPGSVAVSMFPLTAPIGRALLVTEHRVRVHDVLGHPVHQGA